jgi:hypothetical protein
MLIGRRRDDLDLVVLAHRPATVSERRLRHAVITDTVITDAVITDTTYPDGLPTGTSIAEAVVARERPRGHSDSISFSTRSSRLRKGSLHNTVRYAWSLSFRCTQSTV